MTVDKKIDLSVVVVTFNDAQHLVSSVQSALEQSDVSLEVIISDDHSTDATPEVARSLATQDARVIYLRRAENSGAPGGPLNDGLSQARGRYVMFLDSDDALAPNACAALLEAAERTNAEIVSGQLVRVLLGKGGERQAWFPEFHDTERFVESLEEFPEQLRDTLKTNKLYRKSFLDRIKARFPEGMYYEDVVFSAETLAKAQGIALIPDEVYEWRVYPREERESITNQRHTRRNLEDRLRSLELAEEAFAPLSDSVQSEFHGKVLAHHLRFYLNDLRDSDDEWAHWVLDAIRPRLEATPLAAYRRGFLGDRALYAAALEGDIEAVRDVLRGKIGGALAGHIFTDGGETFWAPRDRASRPANTQLAKELSDFTDRAGALKPHAKFDYLYAVSSAEVLPDGVEVRGVATDPLSNLADARTTLQLRLATDSLSVDLLVPVSVEAVPNGITWRATLPRLAQLSASDGEPRRMTMHAITADGAVNVSPVQSETDHDLDDPVEPLNTWRLVGEPRTAARFEFSGVVAQRPRRVVVIGDVSWRGRYHLGDEAMTEAAIQQLQARGCEVTLVAGDPQLSAEFYGVDTVPVFGFAKCRSAEARELRARTIMETVSGTTPANSADAQTVAAVRSADAVVIAGGGNMNSSGVHHIYERLLLKRIAEAAGVPLYISSQTVGPHLLPADRELVREIASYATVFGARERATTALLRELCGEAGTIVQTLDDAILLDADASDSVAQELPSLPERYVVGSFTYHAFSTGLSREEYYRELARMLDDVVRITDTDVLLLPHMGVLGLTEQEGEDNDQFGHDRIAAYATSGRVTSLPLIAATSVFAVTSGAQFTISTRYHPVVFGAALGVPAIGVVTSYYSALRMRGALAHVGMESFAIPFEHWSLFGSRVLSELSNQRDSYASHVRAAGTAQRDYQAKWWDGIAASIAGSGEALRDDVAGLQPHDWTDARNAELLAVAQTAQEGTNMYRMNNLFTVERHQQQLAELRQDADSARVEAESLRREIAELRHRMRPPGAALRDRVRGALRRGRKQ